MTFASGVAPDEDDLARVRAQELVFERARVHLPRDPFPHYLAHLRVESLRPQAAEALVQDIVFIHGSQPARGADRSPEPDLVIANWQSSRFSELLFGVREGDPYELATALGRSTGRVLQLNLIGFRDGELAHLLTPQHRLSRDEHGQWQRWRPRRQQWTGVRRTGRRQAASQ